MKKYTWKEKFQYHFDNLMSRGTASLIGILFAITAIVVIIAGFLTSVINGDSGATFGRSTWLSLMHAIDAGTLAGDDGSWLFLLLMALVTICGLFITSMLIGILNTGITDKMTSLQKGKSQVLEKNHTVILGFDENALNILSQLILANENHKNCVVVLMDDVDKTEMEDAIHQRIQDTKTTRIICRSGHIDRFSDLSICSVQTCSSVILNVDDDSRTIKAILACVDLLERSDNKSAYVTAMIRDAENLDAARIAGRDRAEILYFKSTIARLMAHTSRQPGISSVFTDLLSYDGDEIYVEALAGAEGHTMEELNLRLPRSLVIGIAGEKEAKINPPADTRVQPGDRVILIEEDDGVSSLAPAEAPVDSSAMVPPTEIAEQPHRSLILGNGELLKRMLKELDNYVAPGSVVVAANHTWEESDNIAASLGLQNIIMDQRTCNIYSRPVLEELLKDKPENVMIMSDYSCDDETADANILLILLHLRNIADTTGQKFTVASEMRKVENQELAKITRVNDFVVSSKITALMMTQISQNRQQRMFLEDLLDEDGSEFYRKPIRRYVKCGVPVNFYTLISSAARYGEVAVGYQLVRDGKMQTICNPEKSQSITFSDEDALIVIAED